ncbi:MAG: RNA-binding transcriptional accessory protein [Alistipes sp.]|nr:RNA-binding transcriptional accessory protein [Candidatus Minthomonas equi]
MEKLYIDSICSSLGVSSWQVEHCIELLEEGSTVPFISRYRKERTGALDDTQVSEVKYQWQRYLELDKRKKSILESLEEQAVLTPELKNNIEACIDSQELEDLYLPYRPKRKTRASVARQKGLEPLAASLYECKNINPEKESEKYLSPEVADKDDALSGARDIISEWIAESAPVRSRLRSDYMKYGRIAVKLAKGKDPDSDEVQKYRSWFDFSENLSKAPSHRVLAMLRGASEGVLSVKVEVDGDRRMDDIYSMVLKGKAQPNDAVALQIDYAVEDAYKRLLHPSIENETLKAAKDKADLESIRLFGDNLRQLLMAAPLGQKRMMAIDPGFRTGCKVVCLDAQGALLHNDTIYPHPPQNERTMAMKKISSMVEAYDIEVIAIGNGTAGRETDAFIKKIALPEGVKVYSVSEDGASVYSASPVAREEFPEYDVTVRGAVSIGRRLMDPLSELVKIDPKSIGVGQYQHDVDQTLLKESLDSVVESCVNSVGVNLNTASRHLLGYVSGIGTALARNIVEYRDCNGPFSSRKELLKVKRLGDKVFEQCAGFLRIPDARDPLDNTAVHPERYALVKKIAADSGVSVSELIRDESKRKGVDLKKYVSQDVGLPTLNDIFQELAKPGRDPRAAFTVLEFSDDIRTLEDLKTGMELPGIVTNITDFGAFVDVGIKQNGLIHISRMGKGKRVNSPSDILKIHQHIKVRVVEVDLRRGRIALELI